MACKVINGPGGPTFICGPRPKQNRCAFCASPSTKLCDWPVERAKKVPCTDLKAGDRIFPFSDSKEPRTLFSVERIPQPNFPAMLQAVEVQWKWNGVDSQPYRFKPSALVSLAIKGTCDKSCCHAHHRHVGTDRDYCQDHWRQEDIP